MFDNKLDVCTFETCCCAVKLRAQTVIYVRRVAGLHYGVAGLHYEQLNDIDQSDWLVALDL